jgi:TDG/mug DNA glycosylase family protein
MGADDTLPDIVGPGLRVLFVGTAVGSRSAEIRHYCSGAGNSFYRDLHRCDLTDRKLTPLEDRMLPQYGLGLGDSPLDMPCCEAAVVKRRG